MVLGILAHVDAGKTTLSEAILYTTGQIRSLGRVDHQDAFLDTDAQERQRGITIFSKQARFGDHTLLDTPGHVDFSAEMERTLMVLDYCIMVVSGTDGVQGHTRTLWRLLRHYDIPTFIFVNKMDLPGADREAVLAELKSELSDTIVDFSKEGEDTFYEDIAVCGEKLLNEYMETGRIEAKKIANAIARRKLYPCYFGSALKVEGVDELLAGLKQYMIKKQYGSEFAARVYKIGRDSRGTRLTWLKVTGGVLKVKDRIAYDGLEEKADQLRLYSADKYDTADEVKAGEVCAVTGLTMTAPGMGLGTEQDESEPVLEPVLTYQILPPMDANPLELMGKLKQLEEEDPQLHIIWNEELREIHAQMMGQVQIEVLTQLIKERFDINVSFGQGSIVYRETIAEPVEGVGHFEPLRHYAEVHLLLEPGEPGTGVQVESACREDVLDLNWQRLIATHVMEREHPGVLTGSSLTDVKITILTGRAHTKHTEGGDFRQATYRAIRNGLKRTKSVLLEPFYSFSLTVPKEQVGRAMSDMKQRFGKFESPEFKGETAILKGTAPVISMQDYSAEVSAYTGGTGNLTLELSGYDVCHNAEEIVGEMGYDSELDAANPTGSVFCAHGAGFIVPWDQVENYMHLPYAAALDEGESDEAAGRAYDTTAAMTSVKPKEVKKQSSFELDKELQQIYEREFGMNKEAMEDQERRRWMKKKADKPKPATVKYDKKGNPIYPSRGPQEECLIVDGYNIIFAWEELKGLLRVNIDSARDKLLDILSDYQGYRGCRLIVVFDAYKRKEHPGTKNRYHNIEVIFTKTDETADAYIERKVHDISGKYKVMVATNDSLEQLTVMSQGALRMSAGNLREEIERVSREGMEQYINS